MQKGHIRQGSVGIDQERLPVRACSTVTVNPKELAAVDEIENDRAKFSPNRIFGWQSSSRLKGIPIEYCDIISPPPFEVGRVAKGLKCLPNGVIERDRNCQPFRKKRAYAVRYFVCARVVAVAESFHNSAETNTKGIKFSLVNFMPLNETDGMCFDKVKELCASDRHYTSFYGSK
jgi:hypothetical protein